MASARPAPLLAVALLAVSLAGRRGVVALLAVGMLAGWLPAPAVPPEEGRPVLLSGSLKRPWRASQDGWIATLEVHHYRQGRRVDLWSQPVTVLLPGGEPPPDGCEIRVRGLLRRSAGLANRPSLPVGPWRLRLKSRHFLEAGGADSASLSWRLGLALRGRIEAVMDRAGDRPGTALARALTLGDRSRLPPRWRRGLRATGLAHLVALSGLHVGLLVGCCLMAGAALPRGLGAIVGVTVAVGFLLLAGARPALLRATAMGLLAGGALLIDRRPYGLALLAVLAMTLAVAEPRLLTDLGYRLTCAATAGILWLTPRFEAGWMALPRWLRQPLAVTCGAQLASLPWSLPAFKLLSPLAPLWNLVAVPWTALALAGCLGWVAVAMVWPSLAVGLAPLLDLAAWPFSAVGELMPSVSRPLPVVAPLWVTVLAAVVLAAVLSGPARRWPILALPLVFLLMRPAEPARLELRMLDVGQGEAVLLRDGDEAILVDGGGWRRGDLGGRVLVPALAAAGVRRLRAVVLTHPDIDHCRGLVDLTSYMSIDEVWTAPGWRSNPCAHQLLTAPGADLRLLWAGEEAAVGQWRLKALHPAAGDRGGGNDRSLVLAATAPGLRLLLTGDIGAATERKLMQRWPASMLRADVLKVGHHGSASATTAGLLGVVRPGLALISCGLGNHYGHPSGEVLRRLDAAGARVLRTDRSGEIVLSRVEGGGWRLTTPGVPRPG